MVQLFCALDVCDLWLMAVARLSRTQQRKAEAYNQKKRVRDVPTILTGAYSPPLMETMLISYPAFLNTQ